MTERERLIELIGKSSMWNLQSQPLLIEQIADSLLAKGVIVPPCKVGDFLYKPKKVGARWVVVEYVITTIMSIEKDKWIIRYKKDKGQTHHQCSIDEIGETVFLSRDEAI